MRTRIEPPPLPYLERLLRFGSVDDRGPKTLAAQAQAYTDLHNVTAIRSLGAGADAERRDAVEKKRKAMLEEAISAVEETKNALSALEKNNKDEALAALQKATGKLEILVSRDPKMALTPIDVDVIAHDIYSSLEASSAPRTRPRTSWRTAKGAAIDRGAGQRARDAHDRSPIGDVSQRDLELTGMLDEVDTQLAAKKASKDTFAGIQSSLSRLRGLIF